jgi:phosphohistidine phosphatase SixA
VSGQHAITAIHPDQRSSRSGLDDRHRAAAASVRQPESGAIADVTIMQLVVVRHAHAGEKRLWRGADVDRPLSALGARQSSWLTEHLCRRRVVSVIASPALRCRQTVSPLADVLGLEVQVCPALAATATDGPGALIGLLLDPAFSDAVVCTHGEVLAPLLDRPDVMAAAQRRGLSRDVLMSKGSASQLQVCADGAVQSLTHLRPP